jgi:hypothetical protein
MRFWKQQKGKGGASLAAIHNVAGADQLALQFPAWLQPTRLAQQEANNREGALAEPRTEVAIV